MACGFAAICRLNDETYSAHRALKMLAPALEASLPAERESGGDRAWDATPWESGPELGEG